MQGVSSSSSSTQFRSTPRKSDSTHNTVYTQGHTNKIRKTNMKTLRPTLPKYDVSYFLDSVVPAVSEDTVDKVFRQLVKDEAIVYDETTKEHRWEWYKDADPSQMGSLEGVVYRHLEDISKAVVEAAKMIDHFKGKLQTVRFSCNPNRASVSETQNSVFKTDGEQELIDGEGHGGKKDLLDSVTSAEFKKTNGVRSSNDNARKLLGNSTHMMSSDARRRFRYGITIEDTQMRLWYFSRALNFVTHDFNFITGSKPFIQFLLATSFATREELGYDPTVVREIISREVVYDYLVEQPGKEPRWYRTVKSMDTHRAARLPGRGVRVWEAKPLDKDRKPYPPGTLGDKKRYVLKDYWPPMDSQSEKEIVEAVVLAAKGVDGMTEADIRKRLMTIERDAAVSIKGKTDNSNLHLRNKMPSPDYDEHILKYDDDDAPPTKPHITSSVNSIPTGGLNIPTERSQDDGRGRRRVFEGCVHRRLVFKEVGKPLYKIKNQKELAKRLVEALHGLRILYRAGFVHRDMSPGNLLVCQLEDGSDICKISDLEYARPRLVPMDENSVQHDVKTGTPAFMALEI